MRKNFLKVIMSFVLTLVVLVSTTNIALAVNPSTPILNEQEWKSKITKEMAAMVKEDGGIDTRAASHPIFEGITGQLNANGGYWSGNYNLSSEFNNGTYKIIWACGGDRWQSTSSVFRATTSSGQDTLLKATGTSPQTYTFNNTNDWNYVWEGNWNLSIKPYSQCSGTYNYLFTFYVTK